MPQHRHPAESLTQQLERLMRELDEDSGDRPATVDEGSFIRVVDQAADDPETDPVVLEEAARRFAEHCLAPYLHSNDLVVLVRELSGLLEIHHRGRIALESLERSEPRQEAIVNLQRIPSEEGATLNRFDAGLVRHALLTRYPGSHVEPLESEEPDRARYRILLQA